MRLEIMQQLGSGTEDITALCSVDAPSYGLLHKHLKFILPLMLAETIDTEIEAVQLASIYFISHGDLDSVIKAASPIEYLRDSVPWCHHRKIYTLPSVKNHIYVLRRLAVAQSTITACVFWFRFLRD